MQRSNVNPSTGPYPWVNLELEPARVSWNERDVLLFANSIGCSVDGHFRFLYVSLRFEQMAMVELLIEVHRKGILNFLHFPPTQRS